MLLKTMLKIIATHNSGEVKSVLFNSICCCQSMGLNQQEHQELHSVQILRSHCRFSKYNNWGRTQVRMLNQPSRWFRLMLKIWESSNPNYIYLPDPSYQDFWFITRNFIKINFLKKKTYKWTLSQQFFWMEYMKR